MSVSTQSAATAALLEAVEVARVAPSTRNTQPWRWRVRTGTLELCAERSRRLPVADPDGRLLTMSCGTALHHVRLALSAAGWQYTAARLPDRSDPDLLARVVIEGRGEPEPVAVRMVRYVRSRRTDRRPVSEETVTAEEMGALIQAAADEGVDLKMLSRDQIVELSVTLSHAEATEVTDPRHREEFARWIGGRRTGALGVPEQSLPERPPETQIPARYFGPPGTLPVSGGHDLAAAYAILHGDVDRPFGWLRGGEALSAVWLRATELDLSVVPICAVAELPSTRERLRVQMSGLSHPYLAIRVGRPDVAQPGPPATPRLPFQEIVEMPGEERRDR